MPESTSIKIFLFMKVIAESGSTTTEWVLVDGKNVLERSFTEGINPFFQTRREISHSIRLNLPETFFKKRWERVYFYGAGCANLDKKNILEASLVAQFKTPISAESDLLAAARGLLIGNSLYLGDRFEFLSIRRRTYH